MFDKKIAAGQLSAWVFTAITPPLIQLAGGSSWAWLLGLGAVCFLVNWLRGRWGCEELPKVLCLPVLVLTVILLGELASYSAESWPTRDSFPAVPLILLALAAWSAGKGPQAAARVGAVLFWFVVIMYMVVFAAGIKQVRWQWISLSGIMPQALCSVLLLVPSAALLLPVDRKCAMGKTLLGLGIAVAAILLTQGILSPGVAAEAKQPFHEMSRSLELLGIAQRFEAFLCAASTAGWFALLNLFLSIGGEVCHRLAAGWKKPGIWFAAILAAFWLLCGLHISGLIMAFACAVFWVIIPVLVQGIGKIKKS